MKYAAAYVRMSDDDQDLSPEQQWAQICNRAAKDGYAIHPACRFEDQGRSGWKKKVRRPGYERMMRMVREGRLTELNVVRVYFWKSNRLARRRVILLETFQAFEDAGIEPVAIAESWPEDSKMKKMLQTLTGLMDEMYSDNLSEDVTRGMRSQGAKGYWMYGHVPYGYRGLKARADEPPRLEPDPEVWPHLQRLLQMRFQDGDGHRKIAERLMRERIPSPRRQDIERRKPAEHWRPKHVREILGNLVYTGAIPWHPKDPRTGRRSRDPETGREVVEILCENAHTPLFTREQWEQERQIRARNRRVGQRRNPMRIGDRGLFTPWLRCGLCGAKVRIQNGGGAGRELWYYLCGANLENREACSGFRGRTDLLDPTLRRSVEEAVLTDEGARQLIHASIAAWRDTPVGALAERRSQLKQEEADTTQRIARLLRAVEDGEHDEDVSVRLRELRSTREAIREDLAALPDDGAPPDPDSIDIDAFRKGILAAWRDKPVLEQRQALQQLLDSIVLYPTGAAVIRFAWSGPAGDIYQSPFGPPEGSGPIRRGWAACSEVSPPMQYATGRA